MAIARPLTKELLKKLFLKTRYEMRKGGRLAGHSWSNGGVISSIPTIFPELGKVLSPDEQFMAIRAAFELERDGFIWQDPPQGPDDKLLSDLGNKVVQDTLEAMRLPTIDIDQLLSRDDLRSLVRDDFNAADYGTAVFKAFRLLEESARAKANEPPSSLGVSLTSAAFSPANGKLKHPGAAVPQEQDGLHQLMRGRLLGSRTPSVTGRYPAMTPSRPRTSSRSQTCYSTCSTNVP